MQMLHRMRTHQFAPRQRPAGKQIKPHEQKPDMVVSLKHDDLYARTCECNYEQPFFDAEKNNATPPNSTESPVQSNTKN